MGCGASSSAGQPADNLTSVSPVHAPAPAPTSDNSAIRRFTCPLHPSGAPIGESCAVCMAIPKYPAHFFEFLPKVMPCAPRMPQDEKAPRYSRDPTVERRPLENKLLGQRAHIKSVAADGGVDALDEEVEHADYSGADPARWITAEFCFDGSYSFSTLGEKESVQAPISQGIAALSAAPATYVALWYQANMVDWPEGQQRYTLLRREGTRRFIPRGVGDDGAFKMQTARYHHLPAVEHDRAYEAESLMSYAGASLTKCPSPGRGEGVGDVPGLKLVGAVDPYDVSQGDVGDCWMLSAISAIAEFEGAVRRLFRKTEGALASRPSEHANVYTVTLWDLPTWTEVDVAVDERLVRAADGTSLLGCRISNDGELWQCYLEKAMAVHCGGWDKIDGGYCTHAWAMLTGCREQFTLRKGDGGAWHCYGAYNPNERRWEELTNSPHDGFQGLWPMEWPKVGGGGAIGLALTEEQLFSRLCQWDDANFIMGTGTPQGDDSVQRDDGLVDGHAYSILECRNDVAGTHVDLVKMRNPWGSGEGRGIWGDGGAGWALYPAVEAQIKPVAANDGVFWVSRTEFFAYFETIYVCAANMKEFLAAAADD